MSGGGAMYGGGGKTEGGTPDWAQLMAGNMARRFEGESRGLRTDFISQLQQALTPDANAAAQLPIVASAIDASRRAGSQAMEETETELARTGLAGTPFGERIRSGTQADLGFQTSQIPAQFLAALQAMIPNFVLGQSQTAAGLPAAMSYQEGKDWKGGFEAQGGAMGG